MTSKRGLWNGPNQSREFFTLIVFGIGLGSSKASPKWLLLCGSYPSLVLGLEGLPGANHESSNARSSLVQDLFDQGFSSKTLKYVKACKVKYFPKVEVFRDSYVNMTEMKKIIYLVRRAFRGCLPLLRLYVSLSDLFSGFSLHLGISLNLFSFMSLTSFDSTTWLSY